MKLADASIPWTALGGDCNNVLHLFGLWIRVYFLFLPICTYFAYFACFAYWKGVSVHKGSRSPENATKLYMYKDFKWSLVLQLRSTGQTHTNSIQDERNSVHSYTLTLRKGPGVLSSKHWERGWGGGKKPHFNWGVGGTSPLLQPLSVAINLSLILLFSNFIPSQSTTYLKN